MADETSLQGKCITLKQSTGRPGSSQQSAGTPPDHNKLGLKKRSTSGQSAIRSSQQLREEACIQAQAHKEAELVLMVTETQCKLLKLIRGEDKCQGVGL